jgi:hypothetical protein
MPNDMPEGGTFGEFSFPERIHGTAPPIRTISIHTSCLKNVTAALPDIAYPKIFNDVMKKGIRLAKNSSPFNVHQKVIPCMEYMQRDD